MLNNIVSLSPFSSQAEWKAFLKILKRDMQRNLTLIFIIGLLQSNLVGLAAERVPNMVVFRGQVFEVIKTDGKITDIRLKSEQENPTSDEVPALYILSTEPKQPPISKVILLPSTQDFSPFLVKRLIRLRFARSRLPFPDDEFVIRIG